MRILGTHHYGKLHRDAFKRRVNSHDVLCRLDYSERVLFIFLIKYNKNIMVSIGLYLLKGFPWNTSVRHTIIVHFWHRIVCHFMGCYYFFSGDIKQYAAPIDAHSKIIIELLQNITVLFAYMSTIWESTDGCAEQY